MYKKDGRKHIKSKYKICTQNISLDLYDFSKNLFYNEPQEIKSIQIDFGFPSSEEEFKELILIYTEGMKILYGDICGRVNLNFIQAIVCHGSHF